MRVLMTEDSNDAESSAFLLDDNSRWKEKPFQMCLHDVLLVFSWWTGIPTASWSFSPWCSIPFSVDDLLSSLQEKDFMHVRSAEELMENPAFQFLQEW